LSTRISTAPAIHSSFNGKILIKICFEWDSFRDGSGSKDFALGRVGQPPLVLENFPLKIPNCSNFDHLGQKISLGQVKKIPWSNTGRPLIYCWSEVYSVWARAHL